MEDILLQLVKSLFNMECSLLAQHVLILVLANDTFMWFLSFFKHICFMQDHPEAFKRKQVSYKFLKISCVLDALLCWTLLCYWCYYSVLVAHGAQKTSPFSHIIFFIFICGALLLWIHHYVILGRYNCMPRRFWPLLSQTVSRFLYRSFKITPYPW